MRGWCPGGCVSWGYWALTKETQGRTTAANTADFTQLHTYTSRQQHADTQRETATLFRDYTQPLCVSHKCQHTCAHTHAHTDTNTHTTQQTQFRKSIWDQETNYLNYFPFSLHHSLLLVFLLSILAVFAFVSILVSAFHNTKLLQSSRRKKKKELRRLHVYTGLKKPSCFIFILKHVARIPSPREQWQMNNDGATRLLLYSAWKKPKETAVKPSGPVCSAAPVQQFGLTYTVNAQLCVTAHSVRGDSISPTTFCGKEGNYHVMDFTCTLWK